MTLDRPVLHARRPTGAVPAPFVLIEGEEKAGKTWAAIQLSASPKVGDTYFLDLGEGTADEYGAIPGAMFDVLEHDGTYAQVLEQVLAVKAEATRAKAADEPPVVLIVDTMGDIWDGLKDWVSARARAKPSNQKKLAEDPAADVDIPRNLWNDANSRYRRLLNALLTFPGIVIGTARGKEVSATDPSTGQPYRDGRKDYRVEGEKGLAYAATVWVRMTRAAPPLIVGARSVHAGIKPGRDKPKSVEDDHDNILEWLIFDVLKYDPKAGSARTLSNMTGGDLTEDEKADEEAAQNAQQGPPRTQQRRGHTREEIRNAGRQEQTAGSATPPTGDAPPTIPDESPADPDTEPELPVDDAPDPLVIAVDLLPINSRDDLRDVYSYAQAQRISHHDVKDVLTDAESAALKLTEAPRVELGVLIMRAADYLAKTGEPIRPAKTTAVA